MTLNAAYLSPKGNIISPKGRMVYPSLFKPTLPPKETDEKKARYQANLLIPKGADIKLIVDEVEALIKEKFAENKQAKAKRPILETCDIDSLAEYADDFPLLIRCASKYAPDVVHPNGQRTFKEEEEADEVYGGRWARFSLRLFSWGPTQGNYGVSLGLQNVQMLDHDEAIAGGRVRGVNEFEAATEGTEDLE